ncbi:HAD family phosphatase [Candidatus Woesearchaeota archaeon]|nr:HAD family phosphatase [Candidatus Woesearchaeota archaeon]
MIKAIIFDWFGVCTEDFGKVLGRRLYKKLGINNELIIKSFIRYELSLTLGKINSKDVLSNMFEELSISKNVNDYLHIFKDKPKLNREVFKLTRKLKNKYKTALLSDNFDDMTTTIRKNINLRKYFDYAFFSNEVGLVKRENKIYKFVIKELKCKPNECAFVDDNKGNIKRAEKFGIKGILFTNIRQLRRDFIKLNVRV